MHRHRDCTPPPHVDAVRSHRVPRARGVRVAGILFSGDEVPDSQATICAMGQVASLGRLPRLDPLTPASLRAAAAQLDLGPIA